MRKAHVICAFTRKCKEVIAIRNFHKRIRIDILQKRHCHQLFFIINGLASTLVNNIFHMALHNPLLTRFQ